MNNRGFSLLAMLAFCLFCGICLTISYHFYQRMLGVANTRVISKSNKGQYVEDQNQMVNDYSALGYVPANTDYRALETVLKESAKEYIQKFQIQSDYPIIISLSTLKESGILNTLQDQNQKDCYGYVVYKNSSYLPYLCCHSYTTSHYEKKFE